MIIPSFLRYPQSPPSTVIFFFFQSYADHRDLHSFPTRRSSDLIYAPIGVNDRGGNFAAGNAEFDQCYGVVCATGALPGEPETWIVDHPAEVSNSRNASFTYSGKDDITPITELVFECRVDSADPLAWEDCEYP